MSSQNNQKKVWTSKELDFILAHREELKSIFLKRIEELKNAVIKMPRGEDRDIEIRFVKEFQEWVGTIDNLDYPLDRITWRDI